MAKPITIPNTFANATTAIPLSQLDNNYSTITSAINDANTYGNYAADSGSANAYVVALANLTTTYNAGLPIQFKAANTNTGASTLNVNSQGAKNIYLNNAALTANVIQANAIVSVVYDGTQFQMVSSSGAAATGNVTYGNTTVALGGSSSSIGNLTLQNANITSVAVTFPNSYLANNSVTVGNTSVSLGGTATSVGNVTLNNTTVTGYTETVVTANTSTAYTINIANGTLQILTLTGNCTYTFPTATAGKSFTLFQLQDATGSRTVTWPASVKWPSGTAPTITSTASKGDKFVFTADGTYWWGSTAGQNYL